MKIESFAGDPNFCMQSTLRNLTNPHIFKMRDIQHYQVEAAQSRMYLGNYSNIMINTIICAVSRF